LKKNLCSYVNSTLIIVGCISYISLDVRPPANYNCIKLHTNKHFMKVYKYFDCENILQKIRSKLILEEVMLFNMRMKLSNSKGTDNSV